MPISTSATTASVLENRPTPRPALRPIYPRDLSKNPRRARPRHAGGHREQLGEYPTGGAPDHLAGHSVEEDRERAVGSRARSRRVRSPPLLEEVALLEQVAQRDVEDPLDLERVGDERRALA